jgi:hypothetical protein
MSAKWHYCFNQFYVVTTGNYKLMSIILADHYARLQANSSDIIVSGLVTRTTPVVKSYADAYSAWLTSRATYRGSTKSFENLVKELSSTKIKQWDIAIQGSYLDGTPEYISLLPNGRGPFQKGNYEQKILEVKSLGERLLAYPALSATMDDVNDYYSTIDGARNKQQTDEEQVRLKSEALETARIVAANMMYANLGLLMDKFNKEPERSELYFDLSLIMSPPKDEDTYSGTIAGGDTDNITSENFLDTTIFKLYNNGSTSLKFFTSNSATGAVDDIGFVLEPGTNAVKTAAELGAADNKFLNVTNLDPSNQGMWVVIMM